MKLNVNVRHPASDEYTYETRLERLDLDHERRLDLISGNGFIVSAPKAIKDDIKDPNGIFSPKYGPTLQDVNPFGNRYRCKCGHTTQRFYHGLRCENCGEPVEFKDDNFSMFGYICLKDPYHIIHPNLFMSLAFFIGEKEFMRIIDPQEKKDVNGNDAKDVKKPKNEPFYGIGIMGFYEQFDEIMEYYKNRKPGKRDYYDNIMADRDKVFIQSIPVFTIHLRPYRLDGGVMSFESTNATYNIIAALANAINDDKTIMNRKRKPKNTLLFLDFFHTVDDYYQKDFNVTFIRIIRVFAFLIAVFLPAVYISITTRNYELVPLPLLLMLKAGRTFVPFPAYIEALFMIICFEILKESDLRMSSTSGSAISILGGLILGDAAVAAGIVSPIMIIIIAISSIAGLIFTSIELSNALRIYKIFLLLMGTILGIYGVIVGSLIMLYKIISLKLFGYQYISLDENEILDSFIKINKNIKKRNSKLTRNIERGRYK